MNLGTHILLDLYDCQLQDLSDLEQMKTIMLVTALEIGADIIASKFYKFKPYGVSGVVIIAESHLTIHTWPEYKFCSIDIYSCSKRVDLELAINLLKKFFQPKKVEVKQLERGCIG